MTFYRKKPVVIEARKFETNNDDGTHMESLREWIGSRCWHNNTSLYIMTLEGEMRADVGDYIIKGVRGEFYPCKPDVFWRTYEAIDGT
jgi:hypothetical protein